MSARRRVARVCALWLGWSAPLSTVAGCEPQEIYLFDTTPERPNAPERDSGAPPSDGADTGGAFVQPPCESDACRECVASDACAATSAQLFCHPRTGVCALPCDPSAPEAGQCPMGGRCEPQLGLCVACMIDADCGGERPACDTPSGRCVECVVSDSCAGALPVCDGDAFRCVQCLGDADCAATGEVCLVAERRCVSCRTDADCPAYGGDYEDVRCLPGELRCVECLDDRDCGFDPDKPFCSAELECDDDRR